MSPWLTSLCTATRSLTTGWSGSNWSTPSSPSPIPHDIATYLRLFATMSQAAEFGQAARSRLASIQAGLSGQR